MYSTNGESSDFVTLSHRWPEIQPGMTSPRLLKSNIGSLHRTLPWTMLSRTFQDAIEITRTAGFRYLWIDSLCIIQDDPEDLKTQIQCMGDIYSSSTLTIFALQPGTCFTQRSFRQNPYITPSSRSQETHLYHVNATKGQSVPFEVFARRALPARQQWLPTPAPDNSLFHLPKTTSVLFSRGWVFQEWLLSRRALIFGEGQLVLVCPHGGTGELSGFQPDPNFDLDTNPQLRRFVGVSDGHTQADGGSMAWQSMAYAYGRTCVTVTLDRMLAIEGLARRFRPDFESAYLAGCWRDQLPDNLLWARCGFESERFEDSAGCVAWEWVRRSLESSANPPLGGGYYNIADFPRTGPVGEYLDPSPVPSLDFNGLLYSQLPKVGEFPEVPTWSWLAYPGPTAHAGVVGPLPYCTAIKADFELSASPASGQGQDRFASLSVRGLVTRTSLNQVTAVSDLPEKGCSLAIDGICREPRLHAATDVACMLFRRYLVVEEVITKPRDGLSGQYYFDKKACRLVAIPCTCGSPRESSLPGCPGYVEERIKMVFVREVYMLLVASARHPGSYERRGLMTMSQAYAAFEKGDMVRLPRDCPWLALYDSDARPEGKMSPEDFSQRLKDLRPFQINNADGSKSSVSTSILDGAAEEELKLV